MDKLGKFPTNDKKVYAGKPFVQPIREIPNPLIEFSVDASRYIRSDYTVSAVLETARNRPRSEKPIGAAFLLGVSPSITDDGGVLR